MIDVKSMFVWAWRVFFLPQDWLLPAWRLSPYGSLLSSLDGRSSTRTPKTLTFFRARRVSNKWYWLCWVNKKLSTDLNWPLCAIFSDARAFKLACSPNHDLFNHRILGRARGHSNPVVDHEAKGWWNRLFWVRCGVSLPMCPVAKYRFMFSLHYGRSIVLAISCI